MRFLENMLLKTVPFLEHTPVPHSEFQEYSLCIMLITDSEKSKAWRVRGQEPLPLHGLPFVPHFLINLCGL